MLGLICLYGFMSKTLTESDAHMKLSSLQGLAVLSKKTKASRMLPTVNNKVVKCITRLNVQMEMTKMRELLTLFMVCCSNDHAQKRNVLFEKAVKCQNTNLRGGK